MKNKIVQLSLVVISLLSLSISIYLLSQQKKIAFFDYNKVYNECNLKKELEVDLERVVSSRKSDLDSMQMELSFLSNKIKSGNSSKEELSIFEELKHRYLSFQDKYENENLRIKEQYFMQIRSDINEQSKLFSKEMDYNYFFSATGDGSLMHAKESEDVTNEFLEYINKNK